jgi:hypothetical protein
MRRALFTGLLSLVVTILSIVPASSQVGRTLRRGEMFMLSGGGVVANSCCCILQACNNEGTTCDRYLDNPTCNAGNSIVNQQGNRRNCTGFLQGQNCTEADTTHVCEDIYQCIWDGTANPPVCIQRGEDPTTTSNAPDSCTPVCGAGAGC